MMPAVRSALWSALAAAALLMWAVGRASAAPPHPLSVVYSPAPAANAIHDGAPNVPGLTDAFRQAPIFDDPRWPPARQLLKISGRALAQMGGDAMARHIRAELSRRAGAMAGIDEIVPAQWTEAAAGNLVKAMNALGADAERLVAYASPALVTQVGRVDPRKPLDRKNALLLQGLRHAGAVFLEMYHGNAGPFTREEFAVHTTRWLGRWAPGDPSRLHLFFGFQGGVGWKGIFAWARATPAGRQILANGAGVYGLQSAAEGLEWLSAYRGFLADPAAPPPEGDFPVPVGGGLEVRPPRGRNVFIQIDRPARAVIRLVREGETRGRVIGAVQGPTKGVTVKVPRTVPAGRYEVVVVMQGQGLRDVATMPAVVGPPVATLRLRRDRRGVLRVTLRRGNQTVIRLVPVRPTKGRARAIAKLKGPLRDRAVRIPPRLRPGTYRAIAVSVGSDGRQQAAVRLVHRRR